MIDSSYTIKGQFIAMTERADGLGQVLMTIRDHDGRRQEVAQWGPLLLHCGDELVLSSDGLREDIERDTGFSKSAMDQAGGQDSAVWLWTLPVEATGRLAVEADWLASLKGGTVELMAHSA